MDGHGSLGAVGMKRLNRHPILTALLVPGSHLSWCCGLSQHWEELCVELNRFVACSQTSIYRYTVHPLKTQTPGTQEKTWFGLMFLHFHFGGYFRFQQLVLDVLGECNSNLPMHGTVSPFQIQILYIDGMFLARNALPTLRLKESLQLFGGFVDHSTLFWC